MEWPGIKRKKYTINYDEVNIKKNIRTLYNIGNYFLWLLDFIKQ